MNKKCLSCGENLYGKYRILHKDIIVKVMCSCDKKAELEKKNLEVATEKQDRIKKLISNSLIDSKFRNCTFDKWDFNKGSKKMYELGLKYTKNFKKCMDESLGLLIYGEPGNGKTYLSFCIANKLINDFVPAIAVSTNSMLGRIKKTFNSYGKEAEEDVIRGLKNADLLILDDLGTEPHTDWNTSTIYNIIDGRYRQGLPMIITTNLGIKSNTINGVLADIYGRRTEDRILEMCIPIENKISSIRTKNAEDNTEMLRDILYM